MKFINSSKFHRLDLKLLGGSGAGFYHWKIILVTQKSFDDDENTLSLECRPALAKVQSDEDKSDV